MAADCEDPAPGTRETAAPAAAAELAHVHL